MQSLRPVAVRAAAAILALGVTAAAGATWSSGGASRSRPVSGRSPAGSSLRAIDPTKIACDGPRRFDALANGTGPFCVPKDEIRAIDRPTFVTADRARFLPDVEPVISLDVHGESRAYPVRVLLFREMVNDVVGRQPVLVTFCPLCNSAVAFSRTVAGRTLTFGVAGSLRFANQVMFDRETDTQWQQLTGRSLPNTGPLAGRTLAPLPVQLVDFRTWRAAHPNGLVMREPSGDANPYGRDAYWFYDHGPKQPSVLIRDEPVDPRLPPKWRVTGVATPAGAVAFPDPARGTAPRVRTHRLGSVPLVAFSRFGAAQADRAYYLKDAPPGWSTVVLDSRMDGRTLHFAVRDGRLVEGRTGSEFDFFGRGVSGPLAGRRLRAVPQATSFWFAWVHFFPRTAVAG